jgi:hypothetical protein
MMMNEKDENDENEYYFLYKNILYSILYIKIKK